MPTLDQQVAYLEKYRQHQWSLNKRTIVCFLLATIAIPAVCLLICLLIDLYWRQTIQITATRIFSGVVPAIPFSGFLYYSCNRWWVSLTSRFYLFEGKLNIEADQSRNPAKYWTCILIHGFLLLLLALIVAFPAIAVVFPTTVGITPFD